MEYYGRELVSSNIQAPEKSDCLGSLSSKFKLNPCFHISVCYRLLATDRDNVFDFANRADNGRNSVLQENTSLSGGDTPVCSSVCLA